MPNAVSVVSEEEPWLRCGRCRTVAYTRRWRRNQAVCPSCRHHERLTASERIDLLADPGTFTPLRVAEPAVEDPLRFRDAMSYPDSLAAARRRTGQTESVVCGLATICGHQVVLAVMEFGFLGGSLGSGAGDLLTRAAEHALDERLPLLVVTASGGARMQEGLLSLLQLARISQAVAMLHEQGVLTVSLITDPTYGGVAASFATQADVIIAEPGARLGFAGPRVIEQTIGQKLPSGFQSAELLHRRGLVDLVVPRSQLRDVLDRILTVTQAGTRPGPARLDHPLVTDASELPERDAWESVRLARNRNRPTIRDYLLHLCEVFQELHGDRLQADSAAVVGGLAMIAGRPVVVCGTQKGHTTAELVATNFGMAGPEGYRKALRLFRLAERLRLPVVTLIDTPGAHPGMAAEEGGQALAIADNILNLTGLTVPVVAVITGEGGSGGALAFAVADRVLMLEHSVYSVISPEGCAAIRWHSSDHATVARAAAALRLTAADLLRLGLVDAIVSEPPGGSQADHPGAAERLGAALDRTLAELASVPADRLVRERRGRLRATRPPVATMPGPVMAADVVR